MRNISQGNGRGNIGSPIYYCVFDGLRCRVFVALRRRKGGLYFAVGCVVDKNYKDSHKCSRYDVECLSKIETHRCPFDGDFCKYVRGCRDVLFFSNELPVPLFCFRAIIRRVERGSG